MRREQRLVFGEVAELYDRHRPAYPDVVIDDLVSLAGLDAGSCVLEIGAGTGKATSMFAARGMSVVAVEPSAEMAAVARRVCAAYSSVRIEQGDFERWDPAGRTFPLVFAAQAWHWVDPAVGFAKAAQVLRPGGVLAAFWNRPMWARAPLREVLIDAYRQAGPEVLEETDPMHPANSPSGDETEWRAGVAAAHGLGAAEVREYEWSATYTGRDYSSLLQTHSTVRVMEDERRRALVEAVASAVESHGNVLELPLVTLVYLARRP
ncbi:MAG TPA: class I SAM-dependent methyltransferase [Solirubrobacteraceae bacterium]|nr:class I SAM-dependent methyltransferase [Solirubrobacteraceae bacterium]